MTNWFIDKIDKISQIEKYQRPLEVRLAKLDANENLVLDNTFLIKFIQNIAKETDLRSTLYLYMTIFTRSLVSI